jgi:superfamily II DNA helicase RecQ
MPLPLKEVKPKLQLTNAAKKNSLYSYADVKEWTFSSFAWDDEVKSVLSRKFGKENFRPNQRAIINCVLSRKDVFVCMPTGYGKSLTFQIPACVDKGVTIVVMPLISLVFDQVTYLKTIGVRAENVSGQNKILKY